MKTLIAGAVLSVAVSALFLPAARNLHDVPFVSKPAGIESYRAEHVSATDNAAVEYTEAEKLLVDVDLVAEARRAKVDESTLESVELADRRRPRGSDVTLAWADANRPAMNLWKLGTSKPKLHYECRQDGGLSILVSQAGSRDFIMLASHYADQAMTLEDPDDAWEWHRACIRFTRHLALRGTYLERMIGRSWHSTAIENTVNWCSDTRVPASLLSRAGSEFEQDRTQLVDDGAVLVAEYVFSEAALDRIEDFRDVDFSSPIPGGHPIRRLALAEEVLADRLMRIQFANLAFARRSSQPLKLAATEFAYYIDERTADDTQRMTAKQFENACARLPFAELVLVSRATEEGFYQNLKRRNARDGLIAVVFAVEQFRRVHERYPHKLDEVREAGLLVSVPTDPFSLDGGEIGYRSKGAKTAVVWSVGHDGIDHHGDFTFVRDVGRRDYGYKLGE